MRLGLQKRSGWISFVHFFFLYLLKKNCSLSVSLSLSLSRHSRGGSQFPFMQTNDRSFYRRSCVSQIPHPTSLWSLAVLFLCLGSPDRWHRSLHSFQWTGEDPSIGALKLLTKHPVHPLRCGAAVLFLWPFKLESCHYLILVLCSLTSSNLSFDISSTYYVLIHLLLFLLPGKESVLSDASHFAVEIISRDPLVLLNNIFNWLQVMNIDIWIGGRIMVDLQAVMPGP
jgi:hypothetical protein